MEPTTKATAGRLRGHLGTACLTLSVAASSALASQQPHGPRYERLGPEGMILLGGLLLAAGVFSIYGGVRAPDWFMNNRRARPLVEALGRTGAQAFYVLVGVFVIFVGAVLTLLGINKL